MGGAKEAEGGASGWPACGACGQPVRCGAVLGEASCWCMELPPLDVGRAPGPAGAGGASGGLTPRVAELRDAAPACLCEACLRRRLRAQQGERAGGDTGS